MRKIDLKWSNSTYFIRINTAQFRQFTSSTYTVDAPNIFFSVRNGCGRNSSRTQLPEGLGLFFPETGFFCRHDCCGSAVYGPPYLRVGPLILLPVARLSSGTPLIDGLLLFGAHLRLVVVRWWIGAVWVPLFGALASSRRGENAQGMPRWGTRKKRTENRPRNGTGVRFWTRMLVHCWFTALIFWLGTLLDMEPTWEGQLDREWYLIWPGMLMVLSLLWRNEMIHL